MFGSGKRHVTTLTLNSRWTIDSSGKSSREMRRTSCKRYALNYAAYTYVVQVAIVIFVEKSQISAKGLTSLGGTDARPFFVTFFFRSSSGILAIWAMSGILNGRADGGCCIGNWRGEDGEDIGNCIVRDGVYFEALDPIPSGFLLTFRRDDPNSSITLSKFAIFFSLHRAETPMASKSGSSAWILRVKTEATSSDTGWTETLWESVSLETWAGSLSGVRALQAAAIARWDLGT